ncbi:hypothetical protein KUTeg_019597 [Tegillarca granosa]|uniref:Uncharacterized protein n=1 Tax=Tegillarca granosa TaxID=220873 RepID=A0ABQ9ECY1_TEGGR|nr:hypothetical protein KUTeg_019597 [Tegillarca granosa]
MVVRYNGSLVYQSLRDSSQIPTGRLQVKKTVPDSITSWVATAFGSSQNTGLGIAQKANLEAFQSMFINLRMPYAAIRGESLELKIQVYNYENQKHVANIKLERSEDFGIWLANENREQVMAKSQDFTASMEIMPNNSNVVSVWIEASKIKTMTLKVSASFQGTTISDIVERQLLVKPEGQTVHKTKQILLKLDDKKPMISEQAQVVVPADFIPDSLFIKTTLIGLQRELGYRHNDGSFSAFGTSDPSGSSWLTAFVMKSFSQAKKYIFVDPEIIRKATMFLTGHFSSSSGEFSEPGRVIHSEMQVKYCLIYSFRGGAANGPALTAYIVISLLEGLDALDASVQQQVRSQAITPAINTLKNNFDKDKTTMKPYMLALTAYALSLYGDPKVTEVLQILESLAKVGNGTKCWGDYCLGSDKPVPMANAKMAMDYIIIKPKANTVEIAAYVLLAYIKVNDINKAQPVLNWLVSQMSDIGGFHSTQDTVLGLQALSTFAAKSTQNLNVNVEVSHGTTVHTFPMVTNNNKNMLQRQQIPSDVRSIDIKATGSGTVLLTLVWQYNMKKDLSTQEIDLTVTTSPMNDNNRYKLDICSKYVGKGGSGQMAIVKVEVATGYVADTEKTKKDRNIKRVEEENGIVNIYFDDLDNLKCTSMYASKVENVGEIQPRSVTTQLYYEPETQNVVFYQAQTQQVNCNSDTCSTKGPVGGVGSNGTSVMFFLLCIMVALLV